MNNQINNPHERELRLIYSDKQLFSALLLEVDGSDSINYQNMQVLAIELYSVLRNRL